MSNIVRILIHWLSSILIFISLLSWELLCNFLNINLRYSWKITHSGQKGLISRLFEICVWAESCHQFTRIIVYVKSGTNTDISVCYAYNTLLYRRTLNSMESKQISQSIFCKYNFVIFTSTILTTSNSTKY